MPADDERVRATVEAVAQRLTDSRGLVYFPQALSHVGLVNAAWAITQAQAGRAAPATEALR